MIYLYVTGQRTGEAEEVLRKDPAWAAPLLWRSEFRNTLIGLERHQQVSFADVRIIVAEAEQWMAGRDFQLYRSKSCSWRKSLVVLPMIVNSLALR